MDEWTDGPDQLAGHEETRMQEFLIIPITVILFVKHSCFRLFVYFFNLNQDQCNHKSYIFGSSFYDWGDFYFILVDWEIFGSCEDFFGYFAFGAFTARLYTFDAHTHGHCGKARCSKLNEQQSKRVRIVLIMLKAWQKWWYISCGGV